MVVAEILAVSSSHWFSYFQAPNGEYRFNLTRPLITTHAWKPTVKQCWKPGIYLQGGNGCYETYGAIIPQRGATYEGAPDYRGEIYVTAGGGAAVLTDVTPNTVTLALRRSRTGNDSGQPEHHLRLAGRVRRCDRVYDENLRVTVDVPHSGEVSLRYHPRVLARHSLCVHRWPARARRPGVRRGEA